uniref:Protein containing Grp7 allergen domain n=1 Tax=Rhipicephalus zambeziensis TaxID=60191 RepID=A0A224YYS9_9ACAR
MHIHKGILLISLLLGVAYGSSVTTPERKTDIVTRMLRLGMKYLKVDPMALPDQVLDFSFFGRVFLLQGSVSGLGSIMRTGVNIIRAENGTFSASIDLGTEQLHVNYTALITAAKFSHLVAHMSASVRVTRMALIINQTDAGELQLARFQLINFDGLEVTLDAVKHGDFLINAIINAATKMFRSVLKAKTEETIVREIRSSLKKLNNLLFERTVSESNALLM